METLVIPDVHGDVGILAGLLKQESVIDDAWERVDHENTIVQLGDLANCAGDNTSDLACLQQAEEWLDVYLIGNHEHPYFGGPRFSGFSSDAVIGHKLQLLNGLGLIRAAHVVDGILLTHAGVIRDAVLDADHEPGLAMDWAIALNDQWERNTIHPIFSTIGKSRGGVSRFGGVLWADFSERKHRDFPQIFGHTVDKGVRLKRGGEAQAYPPPREPFVMGPGDQLCLDQGVGGYSDSRSMAAAWIRDGSVEVVYYEWDSQN